MDQSLNVNVLVAAKEEYTNQLITTTTNYFYDIIKQIYQESQLKNERRNISYSNFQRDLKEVPNWSTYKLEEKLSKMNGGLPYLMDLITAIFVSHVKILACVRLKSDDKSIKIKVPTLNVFLHKIIISVSETIFYSPTIIHDDKSKLFDIIAKSIKDTIANQIPIQYILSEYLSGVFDEDEAQLPIPAPVPAIQDDESDEESEHEDEPKNIPIVPIEMPVSKQEPPGTMAEDPVSEEMKSFEELKENKGSTSPVHVTKKEEIEDNSEDSDSESEDGSDSEPEENEEPESKKEETPTLF